MVSDPVSDPDPDPVSVTEKPSPSPVEEDPEVVSISMGTQCPLEVLDFSHKSIYLQYIVLWTFIIFHTV